MSTFRESGQGRWACLMSISQQDFRTSSNPLVKKGCHVGEEIIPLPLHLQADHSFGFEKQELSRQEAIASADYRQFCKEQADAIQRNIGTRGFHRRLETELEADQEKAKNTCKVTFYPHGTGRLRVERRLNGYSWAGSARSGLRELVGQAGFVDEYGIEHEDTRALVPAGGGGKRSKCRGATPRVMARYMDKVYQVDRRIVPVMLTLGWPKNATPDADEATHWLTFYRPKLHYVSRYPAIGWQCSP